MKKILLGLFICCVAAGPVPSALAAETADTPENRLAAAKQYLRVSPIQEMMDDMTEKISLTMPLEQRREFVDLMKRRVQMDVIEQATINGLVKHFTVREIEALAAFYGSPEGKAITKKMGVYMADVMPIIQREIQRAVQQGSE